MNAKVALAGWKKSQFVLWRCTHSQRKFYVFDRTAVKYVGLSVIFPLQVLGFKKIKNRTEDESLSAKPAQSNFVFLSVIIRSW